MPLWSNNANTADAPKNKVLMGTGVTTSTTPRGNVALGNSTVGGFVGLSTIGVFGVDKSNVNHTVLKTPGWSIVKHWTGPVVSVSATNGLFPNGSTFTVTATGAQTATGSLTTNATGNLVSGAMVVPGAGFANISVCTVTLNREKYLSTIGVTGGTGYSNTDTIRVANATINATATLTTNTTGGFANGGIVVTNVGLFANTKANTDVVLTVLAANGAASLGSGATLTANLAASTGGTVTVTGLGGRANRVFVEPIVAMHMGNSSPNIPQA